MINDIGHCRIVLVFLCIQTVVLQSWKAHLHGTLRPRYDIPREPSSKHGRQTSKRSYTLWVAVLHVYSRIVLMPPLTVLYLT
jgi:hypothetical protein